MGCLSVSVSQGTKQFLFAVLMLGFYNLWMPPCLWVYTNPLNELTSGVANLSYFPTINKTGRQNNWIPPTPLTDLYSQAVTGKSNASILPATTIRLQSPTSREKQIQTNILLLLPSLS